MAPQPIEKEKIAHLRFTSDSIVSTDPMKLRSKLEQATRMGNLDRVKVRIIFQDDEGQKYTETTIWATSQRHIVLKGGITIPIHRIIDVRLI